MLCNVCSNIHFRHIDTCEIIKREPDRLRADQREAYSSDVFYIHHKDKWALQSSADQGCHFCGMLWLNLFENASGIFSKSPPLAFARGEVILRRDVVKRWIDKEFGLEHWNREDWIYVHYEGASAKTSSIVECQGVVTKMLEALTAGDNIDLPKPSEYESNHVSSHDDEELQVLSINSLLEQNPQAFSPWVDISTISPANLALASFWINNCIKLHNPCRQFQTRNTLPTRIIDVSDPYHPLLVDGENKSDQYITLSYKWGKLYDHLTKEENLSKYRTEIPLQVLPWTIKEAIHVTNALGYRWLWVDSLCIIQNSEEDKKKEIGKMDQIFRCSTFTLFAAAGNDANAGLSVSRDPRSVKPCRLNLKTTLSQNIVEGTACITIDHPEEPFPLFERGWVLQEQVLATRGLIFGSNQLRWRCLCGSSGESHPEPTGRIESRIELGQPIWDHWRSYSAGSDGFDKMRLWLMATDGLPNQPIRVRDHQFGGSFSTRDNQFDSWYSLVNEYSRRSLTNSSDILPALAGIASAMSKTHSCTYIAGLWQEDLQIGLTWYVVNGEHRNIDMDNGPSHETASLNMPSWTWACQWGKEIGFREWYNECDIVTHEGIALASIFNQEAVSGPDNFVAFANRPLYVTGRLRTALLSPIQDFWSEEDSPRNENGRWVSKIVDPVTKDTIGQIAFDSPPSHLSPKLIYCLLCSVKRRDQYSDKDTREDPWEDEWHLTCLGLSPTGRFDEEYFRIGLVFIWRTGWFGYLDKIPHRETPIDRKTIRLV